jgi:hypothetical protein
MEQKHKGMGQRDLNLPLNMGEKQTQAMYHQLISVWLNQLFKSNLKEKILLKLKINM